MNLRRDNLNLAANEGLVLARFAGGFRQCGASSLNSLLGGTGRISGRSTETSNPMRVADGCRITTTQNNSMKNNYIIRAWKDQPNHNSLTAELRATLSVHPLGSTHLSSLETRRTQRSVDVIRYSEGADWKGRPRNYRELN